jgi:hypothetical protein
VFQSQGKLREAIWHFSEALRIEPDYLEAHNNLKHALTLKGKSAKEVSTAETPKS